MKNIFIFLFIIIFSQGGFAVEINEPAPDFTLKTVDGNDYILSKSIGVKPVYLVFWATWCPTCRAEISHIKELYKKYGGEINIVAINVGQDDSIEKVKKYQQEHELPYVLAFDEGSIISRLYGVIGTPWQIIIDIDGIVRYRSHKTPMNLGQHLLALSRSNKLE